MLTVHVLPITESQPDQLLKAAPTSGLAVSVTVVPWMKFVVHAPPEPQAIPAGDDTTTPEPWRPTVNETAKRAVTLRACVTEVVQVLPEGDSQPTQSLKTTPDPGVAVNTTLVP